MKLADYLEGIQFKCNVEVGKTITVTGPNAQNLVRFQIAAYELKIDPIEDEAYYTYCLHY